jgi:hypothetical protein
MFAKFVAMMLLTLLSICVTFGNYWYTFGIWPRSWVAFLGFGLIQLMVTGLVHAVAQSK